MQYTKFKKHIENKINEFPLQFAFDEKQLKEAMSKLKVDSKEDILHVGGGCLIRKVDKEKYLNLFKSIDTELKDKLKDDDFLYDALLYELGNHEFIITGSYEDALRALNLSYESMSSREIEILMRATQQIEGSINTKYKIQCRETGDVIECNLTEEEAEDILNEYEENDTVEGKYIPDFYEIREMDTEETGN